MVFKLQYGPETFEGSFRPYPESQDDLTKEYTLVYIIRILNVIEGTSPNQDTLVSLGIGKP